MTPTFDTLNDAVDTNGLTLVTMEQLRNAYGAPRLRETVADNISHKLHSLGIGHLPTTLPANRTATIRLYRNGTRLAQVITAVTHPDPDGDQLLLSIDRDDAADTINRIRELIDGIH